MTFSEQHPKLFHIVTASNRVSVCVCTRVCVSEPENVSFFAVLQVIIISKHYSDRSTGLKSICHRVSTCVTDILLLQPREGGGLCSNLSHSDPSISHIGELRWLLRAETIIIGRAHPPCSPLVVILNKT